MVELIFGTFKVDLDWLVGSFFSETEALERDWGGKTLSEFGLKL